MRNVIRNPDGSENVWTAFSHSGKERNRVFMNQGGKSFVNVSGVSGADSVLDGRSFVTWDFNRDGKQDLALVNANDRLLQIFENQTKGDHGVVAFKLEGTESNRDAIGTRIELQTDRGTLMRVLSCGEGFAGQNSRTLVVGIGSATRILGATIYWRSGKETQVNDISSGDRITVREGEDQPEVGRIQN